MIQDVQKPVLHVLHPTTLSAQATHPVPSKIKFVEQEMQFVALQVLQLVGHLTQFEVVVSTATT